MSSRFYFFCVVIAAHVLLSACTPNRSVTAVANPDPAVQQFEVFSIHFPPEGAFGYHALDGNSAVISAFGVVDGDVIEQYTRAFQLVDGVWQPGSVVERRGLSARYLDASPALSVAAGVVATRYGLEGQTGLDFTVFRTLAGGEPLRILTTRPGLPTSRMGAARAAAFWRNDVFRSPVFASDGSYLLADGSAADAAEITQLAVSGPASDIAAWTFLPVANAADVLAFDYSGAHVATVETVDAETNLVVYRRSDADGGTFEIASTTLLNNGLSGNTEVSFNRSDLLEFALVSETSADVVTLATDGSVAVILPLVTDGNQSVHVRAAVDFDGNDLRVVDAVPNVLPNSGAAADYQSTLVAWTRTNAAWSGPTRRAIPGPDSKTPPVLSGDWVLYSDDLHVFFAYVGPASLTVNIESGMGAVTSNFGPGSGIIDIANIDCPGSCAADIDPATPGVQPPPSGSDIFLRPVPADGWEFVGFSGTSCTQSADLPTFPDAIDVSLDVNPIVCDAVFQPAGGDPGTALVQLDFTGAAGDRISSDSTLHCTDPGGPVTTDNVCSASFPVGQAITLTAEPAARFQSWQNCVEQAANVCFLNVPAGGVTISATFGDPSSGPMVADQSFTVDRSSAVGTLVGTLVAIADPGATLTFATDDSTGPFLLAADGEITVGMSLADTGTVVFDVTVSDGMQTSAPATVTINVM